MTRVKKRSRAYDASGRQEQAHKTREAILDVAKSAFLSRGYAATTLASIAREAGVSVETIHKAFGGKTGLVRAIYERDLAGTGERPAPERSDAVLAKEADPRVLAKKLGAFTAEVSPLVAPLHLLLRSAAAGDADLAALLRESDDARLARMRDNARVLAKRGLLRRGITAERAAELMWTCTAPELYELVVSKRGWTPEELGELVASVLLAAVFRESR
ncbi:MAG TPA: helix-turn-helix domain-containing protein [Polyangiaceae bacterium]|nr:helix-turn-helix domain-containing protein [Polyangiaceae bacterium]